MATERPGGRNQVERYRLHLSALKHLQRPFGPVCELYAGIKTKQDVTLVNWEVAKVNMKHTAWRSVKSIRAPVAWHLYISSLALKRSLLAVERSSDS